MIVITQATHKGFRCLAITGMQQNLSQNHDAAMFKASCITIIQVLLKLVYGSADGMPNFLQPVVVCACEIGVFTYIMQIFISVGHLSRPGSGSGCETLCDGACLMNIV